MTRGSSLRRGCASPRGLTEAFGAVGSLCAVTAHRVSSVWFPRPRRRRVLDVHGAHRSHQLVGPRAGRARRHHLRCADRAVHADSRAGARGRGPGHRREGRDHAGVHGRLRLVFAQSHPVAVGAGWYLFCRTSRADRDRHGVVPCAWRSFGVATPRADACTIQRPLGRPRNRAVQPDPDPAVRRRHHPRTGCRCCQPETLATVHDRFHRRRQRCRNDLHGNPTWPSWADHLHGNSAAVSCPDRPQREGTREAHHRPRVVGPRRGAGVGHR